MKPIAIGLGLVCLAVPALAQDAAPDIQALMARYVQLFDKGDAAGLAKDVYVSANEAALTSNFRELRADSFGRLDVYDVKLCPVAGDRTRALMTYARIYTFGGKMDDDEAKLFDLVKTPDGWRIASESETRFDAALSC